MLEVLQSLSFCYYPSFKRLFMSYISEPNKHIEEYLDYYCENELCRYAVLINGKWGAGKTWFINRLEEKLKNRGENVIYISLNGVAKKETIDDEIFRFLHPVWADKRVKLLGRIATGLVKATLKFDVNGDGKTNGSVNVALPSVNIDDLFNKGKNLILIFDDVERCKIPITELLGYINYFVEHAKSKVILIGNEAEIYAKDNGYFSEKEKVIGTTFLFKGDVESALESIIDELPESNFKNEIYNYKEQILTIHHLSEYGNMRILKQSIYDFKRFFDKNLFKDDAELIEKLLTYYLIFSIENKKLINSDLFYSDNQDNYISYSKYNLNEFSFYILDKSTWNDIVINNIIDDEKISENLETNYFSYKKEKPEWYKLWHYYELNNIEFLNILNSTITKLENLKYEHFGEVFHVVCAALYFNQQFPTPHNSEEIKIMGDKNIEYICKKMDRLELNNYIKFEDKDHWGGYSYLGCSQDDIKSFIEESIEKIKEFKNSRIKEEADELFKLLNENSKLFIRKICLTNSSDNIYYNVPVLCEIPPENFSNTLVGLKFDDVKKVLSALDTRYSVDRSIIEDILVEKEWLNKVLEHLTYIANQKTGIEKYSIQSVLIDRISGIQKKIPN